MDVRTWAAEDLLLYWTTTKGQGVRSGASSEGQRGRGHHLKDKRHGGLRDDIELYILPSFSTSQALELWARSWRGDIASSTS